MRIFIETSIFIRFLTKDVASKFKECIQLFELVDSGKIKPYTSNIVMQEILYILTRMYKFPKRQVIKDLTVILNLRNLTLLETTNTKKALSLYKKYAIKYGDCLIATQVPKGVNLVTYDADFLKLKAISTISPSELH